MNLTLDVLLESWSLVAGWLVFIVLLFVTRKAPRLRPVRIPLFLILLSLSFLKFVENQNENLRIFGFILIGCTFAFILARLLVYISFNLIIDPRRGQKTPALIQAIAFFALILLFLLIFNEFLPSSQRFDLTGIFASAAVISVVLGFALQDTLGNLFSGLALQLENPVQVGQWIRIGNTVGKVVEKDWRSIKLRTLQYDYHVIPNSMAATQLIINYSDPPVPHRREVILRAPWSASPDNIRSAVLPILNAHPDIVSSPAPNVLVKSFGDHWVDYEVRYWYRDFSKIELIDAEIRRQSWYHFRRDRIESPTPIANLQVQRAGHEPRDRADRLKELKRRLNDIAIFEPLEEPEIQQLAEDMTFSLFAAGEDIIRQGDRGDSFYVLLSGEAEVRVQAEDGTTAVVKVLRGGDYFGEMALLTGEARTATITAISESACFELDSDQFSRILHNKPGIADVLSEILTRRRAEMEESIMAKRQDRADAKEQHEQKSVLFRIKKYFGLK